MRFRPSLLQAFRHRALKGELTYAAPRNDFNLLTPELGVPQLYEIGAKRNTPTEGLYSSLRRPRARTLGLLQLPSPGIDYLSWTCRTGE